MRARGRGTFKKKRKKNKQTRRKGINKDEGERIRNYDGTKDRCERGMKKA